jgi:hypothetical protein
MSLAELLLGWRRVAKWEISHGLQEHRVQSWGDRAGLLEPAIPGSPVFNGQLRL